MPVALDHLVARSAGLKDNAVLRLESDGDVTTAERGIFGKFLQLFRNTDAPGTRTMERALLHEVRTNFGNAIAEQAFGMVRSGTEASGKPITAGQVRQLKAYVTQLSQQEQRQTASDAALRCAPAAAAFGKIAAMAGVPPEPLSVHQKQLYMELLQQRLAYAADGPVTDKLRVREKATETLSYVASLDTAAISQHLSALKLARVAAGELVRLLGTRDSGSKELAAAVLRFHITALASAEAANNGRSPGDNEIRNAKLTALRQALNELTPREARERFEQAMSPQGAGRALVCAATANRVFRDAEARVGYVTSETANLAASMWYNSMAALAALGERGGVSSAHAQIGAIRAASSNEARTTVTITDRMARAAGMKSPERALEILDDLSGFADRHVREAQEKAKARARAQAGPAAQPPAQQPQPAAIAGSAQPPAQPPPAAGGAQTQLPGARFANERGAVLRETREVLTPDLLNRSLFQVGVLATPGGTLEDAVLLNVKGVIMAEVSRQAEMRRQGGGSPADLSRQEVEVLVDQAIVRLAPDIRDVVNWTPRMTDAVNNLVGPGKAGDPQRNGQATEEFTQCLADKTGGLVDRVKDEAALKEELQAVDGAVSDLSQPGVSRDEAKMKELVTWQRNLRRQLGTLQAVKEFLTAQGGALGIAKENLDQRIIGDWITTLTPEAAYVLERHVKEVLRSMGNVAPGSPEMAQLQTYLRFLSEELKKVLAPKRSEPAVQPSDADKARRDDVRQKEERTSAIGQAGHIALPTDLVVARATLKELGLNYLGDRDRLARLIMEELNPDSPPSGFILDTLSSTLKAEFAGLVDAQGAYAVAEFERLGGLEPLIRKVIKANVVLGPRRPTGSSVNQSGGAGLPKSATAEATPSSASSPASQPKTDKMTPAEIRKARREARAAKLTPLGAAIRIQRTWKANRQRIADKFAEEDKKPGSPAKVVTTTSSRGLGAMTNIHFRDDATARRHGMPRTMSIPDPPPSNAPGGGRSFHLGTGNNARFFQGVRDFVVRAPRTDAPQTELVGPPADPVEYADLDCFVPFIPVPQGVGADGVRIGRYSRKMGVRFNDYLDGRPLDGLERRRGKFQLRNFEDISGQLNLLHLRGIYHLDIVADNMTITERANELPKLRFIETSGMVKPAPGDRHASLRATSQNSHNYIRTRAKPEGVNVVVSHEADDEYALLMTMLEASSPRTYDVLLEEVFDGRPPSGRLETAMDDFVAGAIKREHRDEVRNFMREPWNHVLSTPLHDMVDWEHGRLGVS
ncbi:hypothetical protein [Hyphomicrobium sp. MC1]|uniref:hypothetical protein n=1 Tax=Hyphomicrobium sp. (strain MC1) TaxID=717785 RepID=UPI000213EFD5|nr:hypothetical protein [Hyphomicrobium sp. MC1]CCB66674.1 protein of unknown function [Hyphomicrobium sp. MC1]